MQQMIDPDTGNAGTLGMVFRSAIAGAIGVWAVDRLDWFLFRQEDPQARQLTIMCVHKSLIQRMWQPKRLSHSWVHHCTRHNRTPPELQFIRL